MCILHNALQTCFLQKSFEKLLSSQGCRQEFFQVRAHSHFSNSRGGLNPNFGRFNHGQNERIFGPGGHGPRLPMPVYAYASSPLYIAPACHFYVLLLNTVMLETCATLFIRICHSSKCIFFLLFEIHLLRHGRDQPN